VRFKVLVSHWESHLFAMLNACARRLAGFQAPSRSQFS
jgi:hypothetical protein